MVGLNMANGTALKGTQTALPFAAKEHAAEVIEDSFWTNRQRADNNLHEVPYRACFKPQLPGYFIERFTKPGELVFDPFLGRGTTAVSAALAGRIPAGCDINPLALLLTRPRLHPPEPAAVEHRLKEIPWHSDAGHDPDLLAFYHPETLTQILALRTYLLERERAKTLDAVDDWVRLAALTRLSGHSTHFFSVYTLPPNQATSARRQRIINANRNQRPEPRDVSAIILRKSRSLLADTDPDSRAALRAIGGKAILWCGSSCNSSPLGRKKVKLVVTSPPFLNEVDYRTDNWLRCWFSGIAVDEVAVSQRGGLEPWRAMMLRTLRACASVLAEDGRIAVEVGEVRKGTILLENPLATAGLEAGLVPETLMINRQSFTKTSNCWGVNNQEKGTNTNRILVFRKAR